MSHVAQISSGKIWTLIRRAKFTFKCNNKTSHRHIRSNMCLAVLLLRRAHVMQQVGCEAHEPSRK